MQEQKTFQELCDDNFEYLKCNNILRELNNKNLNWITYIIFKCNKLGFFTLTSQPGSSHNAVIYKSAHDRKYETNNILHKDGLRLQRAYPTILVARGYMHKDMANYVVSKLINDDFLFARTENLNNIGANFDIKVGSVNFYNNEPLVKKMYSVECIDELKKIPDGDESYNFEFPLHRPFNFIKSENNINYNDIVEFDILDTRWNNNDCLWKKLLELIVAYGSK
jgi:hypothetical protein